MATAALCSGCDEPVVAQSSSATVGGVKFSLGDYEIRYLEVDDGGNTYEYPQPALVMPITVENTGKDDFTYNPTHSTQQMAEAQTPLLYLDPGAEADLPPESKTLINGVYLEKGRLDGQATESTTLKSGDKLTDLFLFEVPDEETDSLILSVPPSMHRGKYPVLFRIDYTPREPKGPKVHSTGDTVSFGPVDFTLTGSDVAYVKTDDSAQGEGFSSEPLLKVNYSITNNSEEPILYDPAHRDLGGRGASLFGKEATYKRVKFAATTSIEGQITGTTQVDPGDTLKDFVLFDRPGEGVSQLSFEYPAALFGQRGIARYQIDYQYEDPPLPEELKKDEKKTEKEDSEEESKGG